MTANELAAFDELYDAHGAIARELALATDALLAVADGVPLDKLAAALADVGRHVEHAYDIAATERQRWAR